VNAASFGEHRFVLWSGLERLSQPEFDAVLSHEIAHDQLQHARHKAELADVVAWAAQVVGTVTGSDQRTTSTLEAWSGKLVLPAYSRQQEYAADSLGVTLLKSVGYDSASVVMCRLLTDLKRSEGVQAQRFFSDHPSLESRIAKLSAAGTTCA